MSERPRPLISGISNGVAPIRVVRHDGPLRPHRQQHAKAMLRGKIRQAVQDLRSNRAKSAKARKRMAWLEARIEADDYPAFRSEDFRNDDLIERMKCEERAEELEALEPDLLQELRVLLVRRNGGIHRKR